MLQWLRVVWWYSTQILTSWSPHAMIVHVLYVVFVKKNSMILRNIDQIRSDISHYSLGQTYSTLTDGPDSKVTRVLRNITCTYS